MDKRTPVSSEAVSRVWALLALLLLLAGAAALRWHKIDAQSLWYDEGNSARIAERSVELIIAGAAGDIHPPLYYVLLKFWRAAFGGGEAALRAFSAACGVLTVFFVQRTGRLLAGERAAWAAGALAAVAPLAVYYGQEARMYALLASCAAMSSWALFHLLRAAQTPVRASRDVVSTPEQRRARILWPALLALATIAGLWTHYAYPFVMAAQGCGVLIRLRASGRRAFASYVIANVVAIAAFAPWAPIAIAQLSGWSVAAQPYVLHEALLDALRWIVVGRTLPLEQSVPALTIIGGLTLAGLAWSKVRADERAMLLLQAAAPLALLFAFGLYRDAYLKFLLVCTAPAFLLAGIGIAAAAERLSRRRTAAAFTGALLTAALFVPSLRNLYDDPAYARDDYRRIHAMVRDSGDPDEAAVAFVAPNQWEVYTYYQGDDRGLHPLQYLPAYESFADQQLGPIAFGRPRLFVLYYAERDADPNGWYERWLGRHIAKIHEEWVGNIRVALYSGANDYRTTVENVRFGDAVMLVRAEADLTRADGVVPVRLTWRADRPLDERYKVFVHIGADDAPPIAQSDSEPQSGYAPTDGWQPGVDVLDERGAWLRPGAPPGRWGVFVGMYDAATGERLGERLRIGVIDSPRGRGAVSQVSAPGFR